MSLKHKFKKSKVQLKIISENSGKLTKKIIHEKDQEIIDLNILLNIEKDKLNALKSKLDVKVKESPRKIEIKEEKSQLKISQRPLDSSQGTSKDTKSTQVTKDAKSTETAKVEKSPKKHSEGLARKRESPSGEEQVLLILHFHKLKKIPAFVWHQGPLKSWSPVITFKGRGKGVISPPPPF